MRKNYLLLLSALFLFGCGDGETYEEDVYVSNASSQPTVTITLLEEPDSDNINVLFTPSSGTELVEFAISLSEDYADFNNGQIATEKVSGNQSFEYKFDALAEGSQYMIFARAYNADNVAGPTTTKMITTFDGSLYLAPNFIGSESMGITFYGVPDYHTVECALVTSYDQTVIESFESGDFEKTTMTDVYNSFTVNFFDLEEETTYYMLFRGLDRFNNWTKTFVAEYATENSNDVPSMTTNISFNGIWLTDVRYYPNDLVGKQFIYVISYDLESNYVMGMGYYAGDMLNYLNTMTSSYSGYVFTGNTTRLYTNSYMTIELEFFAYILLYDNDGNPSSVIKRTWTSPEYDSSAGIANVTVSVVPTTDGGTYTFTANDDTEGFFFETFEKDWLDSAASTAGVTAESYVGSNYFTTSRFYTYTGYIGTQFQYRYIDSTGNTDSQFWNLSFVEDSATSYVSGDWMTIGIVPFNKNGVTMGIGEVVLYSYQIL